MLEESARSFSGWKKRELAAVISPHVSSWAEQSSGVNGTLSLGFLTVKCLWMITGTAATLKVCVLPALPRLRGSQQLRLFVFCTWQLPTILPVSAAADAEMGCDCQGSFQGGGWGMKETSRSIDRTRRQ